MYTTKIARKLAKNKKKTIRSLKLTIKNKYFARYKLLN